MSTIAIVDNNDHESTLVVGSSTTTTPFTRRNYLQDMLDPYYMQPSDNP